LKGIGYHRQPVRLESVKPGPGWVIVLEALSRQADADLVLPGLQNTTRGQVLAIGSLAEKESGLVVGDDVIYEEYMGGRWQFPTADGQEARVLIMHVDWILLGIREN
jgi:co-chaperonin GroES (HSP10)